MQQVNDSIEIGMYAACLADNWLNELYEKSGKGYIAALDEITAWAHEFYNNYYEKLKDWETFEQSTDNTYQAACWDDFVIAWGKTDWQNSSQNIKTNRTGWLPLGAF